MTSRIVIVQGHHGPDPNRHSGALADAYAEGAEASGHEVAKVDLARPNFPLVRTQEGFLHGSAPQEPEPAKKVILRAEHPVFVFPLWPGTMPALLKGFLEQIMRSGVAFAYGSKGFPETPLEGRSARVSHHGACRRSSIAGGFSALDCAACGATSSNSWGSAA